MIGLNQIRSAAPMTTHEQLRQALASAIGLIMTTPSMSCDDGALLILDLLEENGIIGRAFTTDLLSPEIEEALNKIESIRLKTQKINTFTAEQEIENMTKHHDKFIENVGQKKYDLLLKKLLDYKASKEYKQK